MTIKLFLTKPYKTRLKFVKLFWHVEWLLGIYFLLFILGVTAAKGGNFYNEYRVIEVLLLLLFGLLALFQRRYKVTKVELLFFGSMAVGSLFWQDPSFIITGILLACLLYKSFYFLNYNRLMTKLIVLASLFIFLLFPVALWDYIITGEYGAHWYALPWNIRVYDSYFLIVAIFAVWFYLTEKRYKFFYLLFLFLAFFAVLLDGGRSVTLAYTVFIATVSIFHQRARLHLILTYTSSWLAYIAITYTASLGSSSLTIARESSSGRLDLWVNAYQCWSQHPIIGCGFYQLDNYPHLSAHPHNLFIQIMTETGLIGFGFLALIIYKIAKNISWNLKQNYFVIAALLAVSVDLSLSGIHVYPVTQMALLWLFVFLLKNPEFSHAQYFNHNIAKDSYLQRMIVLTVYTIIAIWFAYLIVQSFVFGSDIPITPPRFWGYGYRLF